MFDTDWKDFAWVCDSDDCEFTILRALTISAYLNGKLVFTTECPKCKKQDTFGFHPEEFHLLYHGISGVRFVEPVPSHEDLILVSLDALLPCCFCGEKSELRDMKYSPAGLLVETSCSHCHRPNSVRELSFEAILAFCANRRLHRPLEWLTVDQVARFAEERPRYGPS